MRRRNAEKSSELGSIVQPLDQAWRQFGLDHLGLGLGDIVSHSPISERARVDIQQGIGGPGIAVARLADAARIQQQFGAQRQGLADRK